MTQRDAPFNYQSGLEVTCRVQAFCEVALPRERFRIDLPMVVVRFGARVFIERNVLVRQVAEPRRLPFGSVTGVRTLKRRPKSRAFRATQAHGRHSENVGTNLPP